MNREKVFVIDTNIILNDFTVPFTLRHAHVYLPQIVIHELDKKRNFTDNRSAAFNARAFCRKLRKMIKEQNTVDLEISSTSKLILVPTDVQKTESIMQQLGLEQKADSIIVATAWQLSQENKDVTLLTNDTNMWVTAAALGIGVEDYDVHRQFQSLYSGVKVISLESSELIDRVYNGEQVVLSEEEFPGLNPNQVLVIKSDVSRHSSLIVRFQGYEKPLRRIPKKENMVFSGITPLNKEQSFAFEMLSREKISCVTLAGRAGTGKSMVALSYAIEQLDKDIEKIIVLKPIAPVGKDLGFLPGTLDEKLEPWMESFRDSLDFIFKKDPKDEFQKDGKTIKGRTYDALVDYGILEFKPLTFMRGRSIQNTLIILDEAQNTSVHEIKTLLTRVGEGSKIICLGDVEQIDVPWLDQQNNGLTYLIERGKSSDMIGHITFIKSHRSDLADWASSNL